MITIEEFKKRLYSLYDCSIRTLPPLRPNSSNRGQSLDIVVNRESISFIRGKTKKSIKIDRLVEAYNLLIVNKKLKMNDQQLISIISGDCRRSFLFQLLRHFNLAKIEGNGVTNDVFIAVLL